MANNNPFDWFGKGTRCQMSKEQMIDSYKRYMYARTNQMFKYNDLPETIDKRSLEFLLQSYGYACGFQYEGKPYILLGALAGTFNKDYLPTKMIVTNPFLLKTKSLELTIDKDCVWFRNDSMWQGLEPVFTKYAEMLAEIDISIRIGSINSRILSLISAGDERTKISAEKFIKDVYDGKQPGIIAEQALLESLKTYPYAGSTNTYLKILQEIRQYIYANWYIELGINANYNMKRESLSANEVAVNEDTLLPLVDDMINERKKALDKFNSLFGTNISVEFDSSWSKIKEEVQLEIKQKESEIQEVVQEKQEEKQEENKENKEDESTRDE